MKIYKLAQDGQFTFIQQNTGAQPDANTQMQNLTQAQNAINYVRGTVTPLLETAQSLATTIKDVSGVDVTTQITQLVYEALSQSNVFKFLSHAFPNIQNPQQLFDSTQINFMEQNVLSGLQTPQVQPGSTNTPNSTNNL